MPVCLPTYTSPLLLLLLGSWYIQLRLQNMHGNVHRQVSDLNANQTEEASGYETRVGGLQ